MCKVLPYFITPAEKIKGRVGFIRHYADDMTTPEGMMSIDICGGVESVVLAVTSCEKVFSQSLHGLVVCDVYGVEVERVPCELLTDWKFDDYESGARKLLRKK